MFIGLIPFALILIPLFLSIFFGLACLSIGSFVEKKIYFILLFSLVFSIFEFARGNLLTGFPWNLISYTWSWSIETVQILSAVGTYSLSLISITIFCIPFLFLEKKKIKKNIITFSIFLAIFAANYFYGLNKINVDRYNYDESVFIKIISPNFDLEYGLTEIEIQERFKKLVRYSDPDKNRKTIFIWPEGVFSGYSYSEILIFRELISDNFSKKHHFF